MKNERVVDGFRITNEEVLEPDPLFGRHHFMVTMRMRSMEGEDRMGWVSFYLNRENEVERRNGGGVPAPSVVYVAMRQWADVILRGIARKMKQGRRRAEKV